jgi:hypothetical protein
MAAAPGLRCVPGWLLEASHVPPPAMNPLLARTATPAQAAIDAAFADEGQLLMVVPEGFGQVYAAEAVEAMEQRLPARPSSALRHRPPSAAQRAASARRRPG